ncbi:unnamed protein product [Polarella glacialis]|uniref:Uncharacterized protein n=1 Tax=Polarella glacialis TaxID=89957 RepID=A0A813H8R5_POLGL|nr:unnamed protein product [Polarella glacialis]
MLQVPARRLGPAQLFKNGTRAFLTRFGDEDERLPDENSAALLCSLMRRLRSEQALGKARLTFPPKLPASNVRGGQRRLPAPAPGGESLQRRSLIRPASNWTPSWSSELLRAGCIGCPGMPCWSAKASDFKTRLLET